MAGTVRAQSLRGYRELVRDLGGNPTRLLWKAGIEPSALDQLTAFIGFENLADLLEESATQLTCPDFGLRLAERQDVGILDTLAVAIRYSATVGEAVRVVSKYLYVYNAAVAFDVSTGVEPGQARLEFRLLPGHYFRSAQTAEHGIGLTWRILTLLSERRASLKRVWFPHPPVANQATYRAHFDAPLSFRSELAALAVAARDLDLQISENNQELHDLAIRYLERQVPPAPAAFTVRVRGAIEALLGTGTSSYSEVARALYMHPRSLQRRLNEEGTTFEAIKDEARRDLAARYLRQPDLPLRQIAALLDYSEQSALGRSCRRWFNMTPQGVRSALLSGSHISSPGEVVAVQDTGEDS
jgi:AraC-like DNA-binding protein